MESAFASVSFRPRIRKPDIPFFVWALEGDELGTFKNSTDLILLVGSLCHDEESEVSCQKTKSCSWCDTVTEEE